MRYLTLLLAEECKYASFYSIYCKPEFLIKHLVGGRRTEMIETEHLSIGTNHSTERGWKAGSETESRHTGGKDRLTVFNRLIVEQTDRRN